MRRKLTFGLHSQESSLNLAPLLDALCEWLGEALDADVACDETPDYETLSERVKSGSIDIAWLPPIVFLRTGADAVSPVLATRRGASGGGFETALVVREDAPARSIEELRGTRAAWVDAWSAAGYVIPRLRLRLGGADPKTFFREEHFYGTHTAAVRAILDGEAEVAGTYARVADGEVVDGAWTRIEGARVRVLAVFGEIPADVIGVGRSVPEPIRAKLAATLAGAADDASRRALVRRIFGAEGFREVAHDSYDGLRTMLALGDWDDLSRA